MSLPRERFWDIQVTKIDSPTRQPLCPGRPASVPLRHTIASSALATQHSRKWLDGVSDVILDPLWRSRTTGIHNYLRLPGTTSPRVRSPWLAADDALQWLPQEPYPDEELDVKSLVVYQHIYSNYQGGGFSTYGTF